MFPWMAISQASAAEGSVWLWCAANFTGSNTVYFSEVFKVDAERLGYLKYETAFARFAIARYDATQGPWNSVCVPSRHGETKTDAEIERDESAKRDRQTATVVMTGWENR